MANFSTQTTANDVRQRQRQRRQHQKAIKQHDSWPTTKERAEHKLINAARAIKKMEHKQQQQQQNSKKANYHKNKIVETTQNDHKSNNKNVFELNSKQNWLIN